VENFSGVMLAATQKFLKWRMMVCEIMNNENGVRYAHQTLWLALLAHKGMRPYGLPEKTDYLRGMPSPGADDMCSNVAP
jgi:hypothetical protein